MKKQIFILLILSFFFTSCASVEVQRMDASTQGDLSGNWNDTDSQLVAKNMINDIINVNNIWLQKFMNKNQKSPVVIVGNIRNLSLEHINTKTFVKDLERSLINSGEVEFVASNEERGQIRQERKEQAQYSSEETMKSEGEEIGADYMLQGSINSIIDKAKGKQIKFYQINLELIEIETHKKAWIGEKKIKKFITQKKFSF